MPLCRNNELPVFTPGGSHTESSHATGLQPGPIFPNKDGPLTADQLFTMLQDMSRSLAKITNQQQATQSRLDMMVTAPNPPQNNQPPAPIARANIQQQPPPQITSVNNVMQPIAPLQNPLATWLHPENNQPRQYYNPLYAPDPQHVGYDAYSLAQYAELVVEPAKKNEAITQL